MKRLPTFLVFIGAVALAFGGVQCDGRADISVALTPTLDLGNRTPDLAMTGIVDVFDLSGSVQLDPGISAIVPAAVPNSIESPITIYGQNFRPGATVTVSSKPCVSASVVSPWIINCIVPAAPRICGPVVVAVTNPDHKSGINTSSFFYGPSAIKFGTPVQSPGQPSLALRALAADVNGDGKLDLAVPGGTSGAAPLYLYLGRGDGTFALGVPYGTSVQDAAIGDMNGDGKPDIVLADSAQSNLTLLIGQGNGSFSPSSIPGTGPSPIAVSVADFDGDRDLDIGYATSTFTVSVIYNLGSGTFDTSKAGVPFSSTPRWVQFADMNRDGRPDLVYGTDVLTNLSLLGVILDKGTAGREAKTITYNTNTSLLIARDVNGDQLVDAVFTAGGKVSVMLNDGAGNLSGRQDLAIGSLVIRSAAVEDLNNDGPMDIVTNNGGFFSYLQSKGGGTYASPLNTFGVVLGSSMVVADFDGDSLKDVAVLGNLGAQSVIQVFPQTCN